MPKIPRVSGIKLSKVIEKTGFTIVRIHGDHAFLYNRETNRKTVIPLTRKTLPVGTIAAVLQQAGLSADDFRRLL